MSDEDTNIAIAELVNGDNEGPFPNYCNDLNAMHEAEKMLNNEQKEIYFLNLMCLYGKWPKSIQSIHATAKQRAEAFLRIFGK